MLDILPATSNQQSYIWCYTTSTPWKEEMCSSYIMETDHLRTCRQPGCMVVVGASCSWTWVERGESLGRAWEERWSTSIRVPQLQLRSKALPHLQKFTLRPISAPYNHSKIIFKFVYTLKIPINIIYIKNIHMMAFMRIPLHVNDQHTPFIEFAWKHLHKYWITKNPVKLEQQYLCACLGYLSARY